VGRCLLEHSSGLLSRTHTVALLNIEPLGSKFVGGHSNEVATNLGFPPTEKTPSCSIVSGPMVLTFGTAVPGVPSLDVNACAGVRIVGAQGS
jgi:hypothetical protein